MGYKFAMLQLASLAMLLAAGTATGKELQWESTSYAGSSKPPTHELPRPLTPPIELTDSGYAERNPRSRRPTLMDVALQQSVQQGLNAMAELYGKIQPQMLLNGQTLEENHPAALLSRFNAPIAETERREMAAYATIEATKAFRHNFQHIDELARQSHAHKISLRRTALEGLCPVRDPPPCMPAAERYRTHDGTCNNKRRPRWGAAQMPFNRFLPPEYGDGVDSVRTAADGSVLSSSRFVSLLVHGAREGEAPLTLMIAQWGQLLDHDMTSTAQPRAINGSIPSCCGGQDFHPSCFPIKVPLDDPWLSPLKVRCLEFLRSAPAQRRDCVLSWREQTNQATSYIDASPIYSNSAKSSDNARVFRNGLLIYGRGNPAEDVCQRGAIATQCIRSGDGRSGEQPGLLAMHHVWVGEHNRIAMELSEMNPHWSDEKLYQETRRIVGAMFQHITYREFLPVILGQQVCSLFDLQLLSTGFYENYDAKVNPTVANAFSSAAFRFGHSLVQNSYMRCDRHHNVINNNVSLHEEFQNGDIGSAGSLHRLLRGMASQRALKRDEFITPELTNHLFQTPGFPFGLDLAAINIQRGRDHGLAPYTSWRVPCGLSPIQSWDDFANVVGPESAKRIGHAYRSVHDIDLFVGGIAERPVVGGLVGPTFACIIAQQFSNARRGDRFWYENGGFESSFTPAQLHSLRRVSLAQVLCRAVGGGTFQPHIFIPAEFTDNERQTCGTGILASIDLSPWLEQDPFQPDHVFNIVPAGDATPPNIKEDKAGFSNRVKPVKPHVDLRPNSAAGFQRPSPSSSNQSKVNDKLDLKRKTLTTNKTPNRTPTPTRKTQAANGISNKLEKSPKITININNVITRKPAGGAAKRTVIINNVPIELRHAEDGNATTTETTTDTTPDENIPEFRELTSNSTEQVDALTETTTTVNRTQRGIVEPKRNLVGDPRLPHNRTTTRKTSAGFSSSRSTSDSTFSSATPSTSRVRISRTTKSSKPSKTTKRNVELRSQQYAGNSPGRPIYPQKVVVNGPSSNDQYEIEINIRQTNKSPVQRPDYSDYTTSTVYRPFYGSYENSYAPHYMDYGSTTPSYAYYPAPNRDPHPSTIQKTKPPTIIYLNDNEDRRTTTRQPNIFQNFINFATNGLNPHGNRRPTLAPEPSPISSSAGHKEQQQRPLVYGESPLSGGTSSSSVYAQRPSSLSESYPVSTSSHIGGNLGSSYLHATSSAATSGHFGSISGVASANGADSTFSFNIRPRPESVSSPVFSSYPRPQSLAQGGGYGLVTQSPYKPDYPHNQPELYYDRELSSSASNASPFSSGSTGYRPLTQTQTQYYGRAPELKEADTPSTDHKLDIHDYDYLSRTLLNDTAPDESVTDNDDSDDYVNYDEDEPNNKHIDFVKLAKLTKAENVTNAAKTFDKDGYMRPELMTDRALNETKDNSNGTYLDDNYVLPVLANETRTVCATEMPRPLLSTSMRSTVNSKVTVFPDSVAKQLGGDDILADTADYDEAIQKAVQLKKLTEVAFAPITVLTKPDRPDNWVIFNKPSEEPLLPQPPAVGSTGAEPTAEVPMPFYSLKNFKQSQAPLDDSKIDAKFT